jgi:hypothetical protein
LSLVVQIDIADINELLMSHLITYCKSKGGGGIYNLIVIHSISEKRCGIVDKKILLVEFELRPFNDYDPPPPPTTRGIFSP